LKRLLLLPHRLRAMLLPLPPLHLLKVKLPLLKVMIRRIRRVSKD
jgi:hypothetical protein